MISCLNFEISSNLLFKSFLLSALTALSFMTVKSMMEKVQFTYSCKNIPIPSRNAYMAKLLLKVESVIKRMRWKAHFFLNPTDQPPKNNYNFKSRKCPPQIEELKPFENDMFKTIENIKFKHTSHPLLSNLKQDIAKVKASDQVIVSADKTRNFYKIDVHDYQKILPQNVTKSYKVANEQQLCNINKEAKRIATSLNIADRIEVTAKQEAYIALKHHEDNIANNPTCRLINPAKTNITRVSKMILESINLKVREYTKGNQWKSTHEVIKWLTNLRSKQSLTFVVFDIVHFYPSISIAILNNALDLA